MGHDDHDGDSGHSHHPHHHAHAPGEKPQAHAEPGHSHEDPGHSHPHPHPRGEASVPEQHKARAPRYAKVFVITCSDTRTEENDEGGRWLRAELAERGHVHAGSRIVRDEPTFIAAALDEAKASGAQVALLTGGTGLSSRDSTFEAIAAQIARPIPGFGELFRSLSYAEIGSAAMLSRAIAGVRADGLLVFAMPGSPSAVRLAGRRLIFPELTHLLEELAR